MTTTSVSAMGTDSFTLDEVKKRAVAVLNRYRDTREAARTPLVRELAELLVAAREHFIREDGTPDWKGRSYAYRMYVREIYDDAHFSREESKNVQANIRYHVGEVLREKLPADQLADIGLAQKSPRERNQEIRAVKSAYLGNLAAARDSGGGALVGLSAAYVVLKRVNPMDLTGLDKRERLIAEDTISDLQTKLDQMQRWLHNED